MPALPHRRAPCIPFLAHVRVLLHPQGENDGFAQLPHTIRLKRAPHGHAETPPHTLLLTHWQTTTMIMRPSPDSTDPAGQGISAQTCPRSMEPLAFKHINPQVHARYMAHGKPVPPRTLTMIEGNTTSLLFSGNPKGNSGSHALSLDAARTKQTAAKLKKRPRTHSTRAAVCQNHASRNPPQNHPCGPAPNRSQTSTPSCRK